MTDPFPVWYLLLGCTGLMMMLVDQVHVVQMNQPLISPAGFFARLGGSVLAASVLGAEVFARFSTWLVVRCRSNRIGAVARALKGAGLLSEAQGDEATAVALFGE